MVKYRQYYKRRLPHWQPPGAILFVTFCLHGSLPRHVSERLSKEADFLKDSLKNLPGDEPELVNAWKRLFKLADDQLDASDKAMHLLNPLVAQQLADSMEAGHILTHYNLHRYSIMPNHVHMLVEPLPENVKLEPEANPAWPPLFYTREGREMLSAQQPLEKLDWRPVSEIVRYLKTSSTEIVRKECDMRGQVWQEESYDHWIRNGQEYERVISYIDQNPVKARLCHREKDWKWSSAHREIEGVGARFRELELW
jgi:REP element-mobilizing transposase RayT